jgi:hypothetical protein
LKRGTIARFAFATAALVAPRARAADCSPPNHLSTCIQADAFWPHPGAGRFAFVGSADTVAPGAVTLGFAATYLARPIVLDVPTADPSGAEVEAVGSMWDVALLGAVGISSALELDIALPLTLHRSGFGVSPLADQRLRPLSGAALGDIRLGGTLRLLRSGEEPSYGLAARLDAVLPSGDDGAFSGEPSLAVVPAFSGEIRGGRWFAGAELGARLRPVSDLAGTRVGPELLIAVGAGAVLIPDDVLSVELEAQALPALSGQRELAFVPGEGQREAMGSNPLLMPAEWLASLRAGLTPEWAASLGAGGGLPLFGAGDLTAPSFRLVLRATYTLDAQR